MVQVGRDLWRSPGPTSCSSWATYNKLPRTMSRCFFRISKEGNSKASLGKPCQCLVTLPVKAFPDVQGEPPVFQFVPIASGPLTEPHCKEPGSVLFAPYFQVFIYMNMIPPTPSLLQAEQSQLSQPFLIGELLQSLNHACGSLWDSLQYAHISLLLGSPEMVTRLWPHQR